MFTGIIFDVFEMMKEVEKLDQKQTRERVEDLVEAKEILKREATHEWSEARLIMKASSSRNDDNVAHSFFLQPQNLKNLSK